MNAWLDLLAMLGAFFLGWNLHTWWLHRGRHVANRRWGA